VSTRGVTQCQHVVSHSVNTWCDTVSTHDVTQCQHMVSHSVNTWCHAVSTHGVTQRQHMVSHSFNTWCHTVWSHSGFVGLFNVVILWPGLLLLHYTKLESFQIPDSTQWLLMLANGLIGTVLSELLWLW